MARSWARNPLRNRVTPAHAVAPSLSLAQSSNTGGKGVAGNCEDENKKPSKELSVLEKLPFILCGVALFLTVIPYFTFNGNYSMFSRTLEWADLSLPTYFASSMLWISLTCHLMSVGLDAIGRHELKQNMRAWIKKDILNASWTSFALTVLAIIIGVGNNATVLLLVLYGLAAPCCTFFVHFLLKRMLAAVVYFKKKRTRSFLVKVEAFLVCIVVFQVFVSYFRTRAALVYPYQRSHEVAFSSMLAAGNNSLVGCEDEASFNASFQLPYEYRYWAVTRKLECPDDPLCGYKSWLHLCRARSIAPLASSIWFNTEQLMTFPIVLCVCPLMLLGSGRIRQSNNGDLDLSGLINPRIILSLILLFIAGLCFLFYLMQMFVETPLYLLGIAPVDPVAASCGLGSTCFKVLLQGWLTYGAEGLCFVLLGFDSVERIARRLGKSPVYFISYKTDDKNDGIVRDLCHHLPPSGEHWLDKYAEDVSTKGMRMGIEEANAFLMVLSPKYFQSEYCCMEVHRALTLKKPIRPVYNNTAYTSRDALKWIPKELDRLKQINFLSVSEDFEHMKLDLKKIQSEPMSYFDGQVPEKIGNYRFDKNSCSIVTVDAGPGNEGAGSMGKSVADIETGGQDVQHSMDQARLLATET